MAEAFGDFQAKSKVRLIYLEIKKRDITLK